jgi:RNA ligase (TIGR02306 family)
MTKEIKIKSIRKIESNSKRYDIETEKYHCFFANDILIHNSQFVLAHNTNDDETIVSSKGMIKKGLVLQDEDENTYWIAAKNDRIVDKIRNNFTDGVIQIFGEVIPIQKGFDYGQTKPTVRIFDLRVNGKSIPYDQVPTDFKDLWVPIVFDGELNLIEKEVVIYSDEEKGIHKTKMTYLLPDDITDLCKGMELVSGKQIHIKEGVVIRPYVDRDAKDGTKLRLKVINPKYKETGEEIN